MLETLQGDSLVLDNYAERNATVLFYLSSRCPATPEAMELVNKTYERYRHDDVLFIGLIGNTEEGAQEVKTFCQHAGVCFPVYRDPKRTVAQKLGATQTLQAYLIDKEGAVRFRGSFANKEMSKLFGKALSNYLREKELPESVDTPGGTPLDNFGNESPLADPYGQPVFHASPVFEKIEGVPAHHCSTLAECPNGDLLCLWYGGSFESADDQQLLLARKPKDACAWDTPQSLPVSQFPTPPGNAVIFRLGQRMGIVWGRMEASRPLVRGGGWESCRLLIRWSDDNGQTWSEDTELDGLQGCLPRNIPLSFSDGRFAIPLSGHGGAMHGAFLLMTSDEGKTWTPSGVMSKGTQPTVIQREDGSLLALLRSKPAILEAVSTDGAANWTPPAATSLNCPESGIAMTKLKNGHILLVHNDSTLARSPLSLTRSTDDGKTWERPMALETNPGEYSYPCILQTADGRIHISYTWRRYSIMHVEITEDWLDKVTRPN